MAGDVQIYHADRAVSESNPFPVSASFSGSVSVGAHANAVDPSYSEGTDNPFSQTLFGALRTVLLNASGADVWGTAGAQAAPVLTIQGDPSGTPIPVSFSAAAVQDVNTKQVNGAAVNVGTGAAGTGTQRVAVASDSTIGVSGNVTVVQSVATNLKVDLSGTLQNATALKVDGSAVTQPVSIAGSVTVVQSTGSNLKVDGSSVTQPISASSLPLPTGAATAANQSSVIGTKAAGVAATNSMLVGGVYNATPPTVADGQQVSVQLDANGFIKVNIAAGAAAGGTSSSYGSAFPAVGTAAGYNDGTNMQAARVFDADSGGGTQYVLGVNLRGSSSGGSVEIGTGSNPVRTDPTGTTAQPVTNTGTFAVQAAQSGTWNIGTVTTVTTVSAVTAISNALPTGANVLGKIGIDQTTPGTTNLVATNADAAIAAGTAPAKAHVGAGVYNATEPSPTTGQTVGIQLDSKGRQRQVIMDAGGNTRGANVDASNRLSVTVDNVSASNISTNISQIGGATVSTGTGAQGSGSQRVTVATDSATVAGSASLPAGSNLIGKTGIDQTTEGTTNAVVVNGQSLVDVAFSTLTRPANTTAYSANDSISDNGTAGSVTALSATPSDANDAPLTLTEIKVDTTDTGLAAGIQIRAYLYNSDPTASSGVGAGDNAAFSNKKAGFIGSMSGTFRAFSDGGMARLVPDEGNFIVCLPSSGGKTIWIQYQTLAAFTPSANSTTLIGRLKGFQGRA